MYAYLLIDLGIQIFFYRVSQKVLPLQISSRIHCEVHCKIILSVMQIYEKTMTCLFSLTKGVQRQAASAVVCFVFASFIQSVILEAVQSKSLASCKTFYFLIHHFVMEPKVKCLPFHFRELTQEKTRIRSSGEGHHTQPKSHSC